MQLLALVIGILAKTALSVGIEGEFNNTLLQAREMLSGMDAKIQITTYQDPYCQGEENYFYDIHYDAPIQNMFQSYKLSRDLDLSEQLDFSTFGTSSQDPEGQSSPCAKFLWTAPNTQKGGKCCTTETAACFRLWHH